MGFIVSFTGLLKVGKLLIEESRTEKLQRSLQLRSGGKSLISPGDKPSTSQLVILCAWDSNVCGKWAI